MKVSYKNKLRLVQDEHFHNSSLNEKEKLKVMLQKGLLVITVMFILMYLSKST